MVFPSINALQLADAAASLAALTLAALALLRAMQSGRPDKPLVLNDDLHETLWVEVRALQQAQRASMDREGARVASPGLVHFCAYGADGPALSFSLAMLDARGDGVVLTSLYGRDQVRLYAKSVQAGKAHIDLADEERLALELAQAGGGHRALDCDGTLVQAAAPAARIPSRRRRA